MTDFPPDEEAYLAQYLKDHPEIVSEIPPVPVVSEPIASDSGGTQDPFEAMSGGRGSLTMPQASESSTPVPMMIQDNGGQGMTTSEKLDRMIDLLERLPREIVKELRES